MLCASLLHLDTIELTPRFWRRLQASTCFANMAMADPILLSSSPAPPQHALLKSPSYVAFMSSSPFLPSPSELVSKHFPRQKLNNGNDKGSTTPGSFVRASTLATSNAKVKEDCFPISKTENTIENPRQATVSRKVTANDCSTARSTISIPKPGQSSKSRAVSTHPVSADQIDGNATRVRQSTLRKKVTKKIAGPQGKSAEKDPDRRKKGRDLSLGFPIMSKSGLDTSVDGSNAARQATKETLEDTQGVDAVEIGPVKAGSCPTQPLKVVQGDVLHLEEAMTRRRGWTPPPDVEVPALGSKGNENISQAANTSFRDISSFLSDFGYDTDIKAKPIATVWADGTTSKRRKVELLQPSNPPAPGSVKPTRAKSPKNKAPTITGKSTAPFMPEQSAQSTGLKQYFSLLTPDSSDHLNREQTNAEVRLKKKDNRLTKKVVQHRKSSDKMKKRGVREQQPLLLPEKAVASANNQTLVFGTSSQLVRDDSPTLIRDIQRAIAESETFDEQTVGEKHHNRRVPVGSKDLWKAAARDLHDGLQEAEATICDNSRINTAHSSSDISQMQLALLPTDDGSLERPHIVDNAIMFNDDALPKSLADASVKTRRSSVSATKRSRKKPEFNHQMPNYNGFTQADLRKEVAKYGFKPIRKREEMIALLRRCWESRHRVVLRAPNPMETLQGESSKAESTERDASMNIKENRYKQDEKKQVAHISRLDAIETQASDINPPRKPRGRPRKEAVSDGDPRTIDISIPDTDDALKQDLSSCRSPHPLEKTVTAALQSDLLVSETASKPLSQTDPDELFRRITMAVKAGPPANDPDNLSFFEKILIYQPIVIEDLTTWLNTKGLGAVGVDEEVGSGLVKAWCEGRSICCLWKENLRGGRRARY